VMMVVIGLFAGVMADRAFRSTSPDAGVSAIVAPATRTP
jgi:hypothetical protein